MIMDGTTLHNDRILENGR